MTAVVEAAPSTRKRAFLLVAVLAITAAVLARALSGELVYDDLLTVARNPRIANLERVPELFSHSMWDFVSINAERAVGYWRPMSSLMLALGWKIGGAAPLAYHVISLVLHLCATAVAFFLALRLARDATVAFYAALLFGVHPAHVESTAWISAINDPLFGLFALLSLLAFERWRERGSIGSPWGSGAWMLLALLSKELAIGIVPAAVALDLARDRGTKSWLRAYLPLVLAFVAYWLARVLVFGDIMAGFDKQTTDLGVGWGRLLLLRVELFGGFVERLVWPADLRLFHPFVPGLTLTSAGFLVPLGFCIAWIGLVVCLWIGRARTALAGALLIPAALSVVLVAVQSLGAYPLSERYLYLACFGFTLCAASIVTRVLPAAFAKILLAVAAAACAWRTYDRIGAWHDGETLFRTSVAQSPDVPYAQWQLGRTLLEKYRRTNDVTDLAEAHTAFERALDLSQRAKHGDESLFTVHDDFLEASLGIGWCSMYEAEIDRFHNFREAVEVFKLATKTYPNRAEAWTGLGVALTAAGDLDAAQSALEKAIALDARFIEAHANLGHLWMKRGKWAEARAEFERALELRPENVDDLLALAGAHERGGDDGAAAAVLERARRAAPNDSRPLVMQGILAAKAGRLDAALALLDQALALREGDAQAWLAKGKVLAAKGEITGALRAFQRASDLSPNNFEANYNAGILLARMQGLIAAAPYLVRAYQFRPHDETGKALRDWLSKQPLQSPDLIIHELASSDGDDKDFDGALEWIEKALAIDPKYGPAHFMKGGMLREKGDKNGAVRELKLACDAMPDSAGAHQACGLLLAEIGDRTGAIEYLGKALSMAEKAEGSSADTRRAIEMLRAKIEELKK